MTRKYSYFRVLSNEEYRTLVEREYPIVTWRGETPGRKRGVGIFIVRGVVYLVDDINHPDYFAMLDDLAEEREEWMALHENLTVEDWIADFKNRMQTSV
jgi:hypothetical protein